MKAAQLIERIAEQDTQIREAEAKVRVIKQRREKSQAALLRLFEKGKIDTQRCGKLTAERKFSAFPSIKDRPKFLKFVLVHQAFDLFQNRVSATALKEWQEGGLKVPGVDVFKKFYISVKVRR